MDALFLLLPVSMLFVLFIGVALWWAVFNGQFDDLDQAARMILDEGGPETAHSKPEPEPPDGRPGRAPAPGERSGVVGVR